MEEIQLPIYDQVASIFTLNLYIKKNFVVDGNYLTKLLEFFHAELAPQSCRPHSLCTKKAGTTRMHVVDYSDQTWKAAKKKLVSGTYSTVSLSCRVGETDEYVLFSTNINPTSLIDEEDMIVGSVSIDIPLGYLQTMVAIPGKIRSLLDFCKAAWAGLSTGMVYGYGNISVTSRYPRERMRRPHPIPVAFASVNVDVNLNTYYTECDGIKGAFWANFLSECYVRRLGGVTKIKEQLPAFQVEPLAANGLLIVATESPLPEDSPENCKRFLLLHKVLQPAFLSLEETPKHMRHLLGYFYKEREDIMVDE